MFNVRFAAWRLGAVAVAIAIAAATAAAPARAAITEKLYGSVNQALVRDHVLPRYRKLEAESAKLVAAVGALCDRPSPAALAGARQAYNTALDAWMGVQHIGFGPVELFMRSFRLYFWPQARGKVGPAVDALLEAGKPIPPDKMRSVSIAAQGLPAVEYLLFEGGERLTKPGTAAHKRCLLLKGIAAGIEAMAQAIVREWTGGAIDFAKTVAKPGPKNPYYTTHKDATLAFFKSLYGGLDLIADIKLKPVVGETVAKARPRLVESRRSGRALRNIIVNLEALQALYVGDAGTGLGTLTRAAGDAKLDALLRRAFRITLADRPQHQGAARRRGHRSQAAAQRREAHAPGARAQADRRHQPGQDARSHGGVQCARW